jgi:hypothetical protein
MRRLAGLLVPLLLAVPAWAQAPARPPAQAAPQAAPQEAAAPEKPMALRAEASVALRGPVGRWGTPVVDDLNRRLYVPRGPGGLTVLGLDGFKPLAEVANTAGSSAVALDPETLRGFSANVPEAGGAPGGITVFDQRNFRPAGSVPVGGVRHIVYDAATKQVAAASDDGTLTLIDPVKLAVTATLPLEGKRPSGLVSDRRGRVFVALADRDAIVVIDMVSRQVATSWQPQGCRTPVGLVFDSFGQRLVVACRGAAAVPGTGGGPGTPAVEGAAVAIDPFSGRPVAAFAVPPAVDSVVHDARNRLLYFMSAATASIMIYRQLDPYRYSPLENVGSRPTAALAVADPRTGRLILPMVEYVATPTLPDGSGGLRFLPNSFALLVMKRLPIE